MNTSSSLKIRFALVAIIGCLSVCCTRVPEGGILPKGYEWGFGWWRITWEYTDGTGAKNNGSYDMMINGSTYQSSDLYEIHGETFFYPVYTMGKIPFEICEDKDVLSYLELGDDELALRTAGNGDYETFIVLNKAKKTVNDSKHKVRRLINPLVVKKYKRDYELAASKYDGGWREGNTAYYDLRPDSTYILTKKGHFVSYRDYAVYIYHEDNDIITFEQDLEDGPDVVVYHRYDSKLAKQEVEERNASKIAGYYFSRQMTLSDNLEVRQNVYFDKDWSGVCYTWTANSKTGKWVSSGSELRFNWHFDNDVLEQAFTRGEKCYWKVDDWPFTGTVLVGQKDDSILYKNYN